MELSHTACLAVLTSPASLPSIPEALEPVARLLFGTPKPAVELPGLKELIGAAVSLAKGHRTKILLPLGGAPAEIALVRRGGDVLFSYYDTTSAPTVVALDHQVDLRALLDACATAAQRLAKTTSGRRSDIMVELGERAANVVVEEDHHPRPPLIHRTGGLTEPSRAQPTLELGFSADIRPGSTATHDATYRADVHAMLFSGVLWAWVGGRRVTLARGPILLAVERMVTAIRALDEAWDSGRAANLRLRSGEFRIEVRLTGTGAVTLVLGSEGQGTVTTTAMDVAGAAMPILRLASDILRAVVAVDRSQSRNLRIRTLREDVRQLRRSIRARASGEGFVNEDPDRLRGEEEEGTPEIELSMGVGSRGTLRFAERWRAEIDELDAGSTFFCGDRLVIASPHFVTAMDRDTGEVLWAREGLGGPSFMADRTLVLVSPDGHMELCDVADGDAFAAARVTPPANQAPTCVPAGGGQLPPVAVFLEGRHRLVAIDLRTGEPRWRSHTCPSGAVRIKRAGRALLVTGADGHIDAIDVATGEVAWRFADSVRFRFQPAVVEGVVIAAAARASGGCLYGIDLYTGQRKWQRHLDAAPSDAPRSTGHLAIASMGRSGQGTLACLTPEDGTLRWMVPDPGVGSGAGVLAVDRALLVNAPGGRLTCLDTGSGATRWTRQLADALRDDVPRRLDLSLRGGALFVPAASVHVLRPADGSAVSPPIEDELIPDFMRVDERGWVYVGEESGRLHAHAAAPRLSLVKA